MGKIRTLFGVLTLLFVALMALPTSALAVLSFTVDTADYMAGAGIIIAALATMWGVKQVVRLVR